MSVCRPNPQIDLTILKMRAAGKPLSEIAVSIGGSISLVCRRRKLLVEKGITVELAERLAAGTISPAAVAAVAVRPPRTLAQAANSPDWRKCLGGCWQKFWSRSGAHRICLRCEHRRSTVTSFTPDTL